MTKHLLLIIFSLILVSGAYGQEFEEVEFNVQRNTNTSRTYYYTSDTLNRRWQGQAILRVEQEKDTISYYSAFVAAQDSILTGSRFIKLRYVERGDTTFVQVFHKDSTSLRPLYVKDGEISKTSSVFAFLLPPEQDTNVIIHYGGIQAITVRDSIYNCIILIEMTPFIKSGYWLRIKGARLFKYKKQMFRTRVYCIRETDYLPVKMFIGDTVKKFYAEGMPLYKSVEWELIRSQ